MGNTTRRILETLFDYGLYFVLLFWYVYLVGERDVEGGWSVHGVMTLPVPLFWALYFPVVEYVTGATLGHHLLDLKVVSLDSAPLRFSRILKRRMVDPVDLFPLGIPAMILVSNSEKKQRIGDSWAHVAVVGSAIPSN
jgi:uncharacterized RDD family membrane protein YckC